MKGVAKTELQKLIAGIKNGSIQMSGNEPKMSIRALRTLLLSGDEVHGELVEQFLSGKLTTEQFKNKLRGASETRIPKPLRRIPSDRIHHLTPLEIAGIVEDMPDNELLTLLQDYEQDEIFFGDTDANVRGGSFDERAHTGARPKASKSKIVYPNELGEDGFREMSAHPRGTRDTMYNTPDRPTTAAEGRGIIDPLLEQGKADIQRGIIADTPRRNHINAELVRQGVIEQGTDIFSANIDDATLARARPYLQSPSLQESAAKAFKTPKLAQLRDDILKAAGKLPTVPKWARVGGVLTVAGVVGDAASANEGVQGLANETGAKQTAAGVNLASGVTGLAALAAPTLAIPSAVFGATSALMDNRIKRDERQERDNDIKAGRIPLSHQDPYSTTITAPKDPIHERGYETIGRVMNLGWNKLGQLRDKLLN